MNGERNFKSAPARESHLIGIICDVLHVLVVYPESLVQTETHLFYQTIRSNFLVCEFDEHGPFVSVT